MTGHPRRLKQSMATSMIEATTQASFQGPIPMRPLGTSIINTLIFLRLPRIEVFSRPSSHLSTCRSTTLFSPVTYFVYAIVGSTFMKPVLSSFIQTNLPCGAFSCGCRPPFRHLTPIHFTVPPSLIGIKSQFLTLVHGYTSTALKHTTRFPLLLETWTTQFSCTIISRAVQPQTLRA